MNIAAGNYALAAGSTQVTAMKNAGWSESATTWRICGGSTDITNVTPSLVQLYALYNSSIVDYFYTISSTVSATYQANGYVLQTSSGYVFATSPSGTGFSGYTAVAIYSANNATTGCNAFGSHAQINAMSSAWTKYLTTAAFYTIA